jgi:hypothetical protein
MKAIQTEAFGNPAEVVKAVDIPDVGAPAAAEVVIAVEASPINQYDLLMIASGYGYRPRLPAITGSSTHLLRRDQRPVADDNRRLRRKAPGGFRRNRETTTHEWRCRPSFQQPILANDRVAKETA